MIQYGTILYYFSSFRSLEVPVSQHYANAAIRKLLTFNNLPNLMPHTESPCLTQLYPLACLPTPPSADTSLGGQVGGLLHYAD